MLCETADKNGDGKIAEAVIHKWDPLGGRPISANNNGMNGADTILDLQVRSGPEASRDAPLLRCLPRGPGCPPMPPPIAIRGMRSLSGEYARPSGPLGNARPWPLGPIGRRLADALLLDVAGLRLRDGLV